MVYITSDLFTTHGPDHPSSSTHGPPTTSPPHALGLGKRKRQQAGEDTRSHLSIREPSRSQSHPAAPPHTHTSLAYTTYPAAQHSSTPAERRPWKHLKRLSPKSSAPCKSAPHHNLMGVELAPSPADLRPCHVCRSAPRRNRDLENYLACRRCDQRTCYICARQCIRGCARAICNKCTVEVGQAGDAWCLDCFSRNLNA